MAAREQNGASKRKLDMEADTTWHLDKRIPISLLLAILMQTGVAFWWGATITSRVENLEKDAMRSAPQADRLTRVEVKLEGVQDGISEIKRLITAKR